jgi:regulator of sigma E protease
MSGFVSQAINIILLVFGFGFVVFFHELGHFLAAKWAGVKVDQFAVGFGQAMFSWRKGLGFRWGSSAKEYESILQADREGIHTKDVTKIGETEYRLNWIPLGGYVKMLGQDDLDPNATATDPRAFNMKPISKRMVIVSAGVIMNVILAAIGFFVLFLIGFDVPPPVVGAVLPNSPAQHAGVKVGDRIVEFDGKVQRDFTKIQLNVALVHEGEAVPLLVEHPDGKRETLTITPTRSDADTTGFLQLGITGSAQLEGTDNKHEIEVVDLKEEKELDPPDVYAVGPGEKIVAINGEKIDPNDKKQLQSFWKLNDAVQQSGGKPVTITVSDGKTTHDSQIVPRFMPPFSGSVSFAGLQPRAVINSITENSNARGKLAPGDIVQSVTVGTDVTHNPSQEALFNILHSAGDNDAKVQLVVLRGDKTITISDLTTIKLGNGKRGLGVQLDCDGTHAVLGGVVRDSSADKAGVAISDSSDTTITSLGGQPVSSFHDIKRIIAAAQPGKLPVTVKSDAGEKTVEISLSDDDIQLAKNLNYRIDTILHPLSEPRKTTNFITAAKWGVEETRDLIVQFYITLSRMFSGSVPAKNMMGPYGIVRAGADFASRGMDYLIWFLAMISANLAVVNFLPIPIVDGGLFMFLIIEKFQGKPLSPRIQSIAQLVGIVLIASVFIFVTYQDIMRH